MDVNSVAEGMKKSKEANPAWGQKCKLCSHRNHFAVKCSENQHSERTTPSKPRYRVNQVASNSVFSSNTDYVLSVNSKRVGKKNNRTIFTRMILNQKQVKFKVDYGATINVIPLRYVHNTKLQPSLNAV